MLFYLHLYEVILPNKFSSGRSKPSAAISFSYQDESIVFRHYFKHNC